MFVLHVAVIGCKQEMSLRGVIPKLENNQVEYQIQVIFFFCFSLRRDNHSLVNVNITNNIIRVLPVICEGGGSLAYLKFYLLCGT